MDIKKVSAALFDFDGVVMDTESQYSVFWNTQGEKYLDITDFGMLMKGMTIGGVFSKFFSGQTNVHQQIIKDLSLFDQSLELEYVSGFKNFVIDLKNNGVQTALVTSSNQVKMNMVYQQFPLFKRDFDLILTAEDFVRSKPNPECYLLGMQKLKSKQHDSFVFEDSFNGLESGLKSGAIVVGLTTSNSYEKIVEKAHYIINDFTGMSFEKLKEWRANKE